jgi:hypothetical protein
MVTTLKDARRSYSLTDKSRPATTPGRGALMEHTTDDGDGTQRTSAWAGREFSPPMVRIVSWFGSEMGELALPLLAIITLSASAACGGILLPASEPAA